ncbi:MAG TPA: winged helix-turn-helix domain-containing protein, partial [Candidatus Saccharimonadales bacterium]|nr:winged helix-turn-helix domain-containing protein [Candidatus Saccharimonadales bacterium]
MSARYLFGGFLLSPSRRLLLREGREVPLVPRYLDLLLLLIRRRDQAVTRGEIMDAVWSDVVVSDGALSQAVRTLRRALGDDPRNARFIRTVSRHGYQFVYSVVEEDDGDPLPPAGPDAETAGTGVTAEASGSGESPDRGDAHPAPAEPGFDALFAELV